MKITNKRILAVILLAATLTACDSLKGNEKEAKPEDTKIEENADQTESEESVDQTESTDEKDAEGTKDQENTDEEKTEGEDADSENAEVESQEAVTSEGSTPKEKLEDAIFKSRVQARAAEILLETNPDSIADIRDDLEALVERSNKLIEEAQRRLDEME